MKIPGTQTILTCILFLAGTFLSAQEKHTISGYTRDQSGEILIGTSIYVAGQNLGTISNSYGFYSITLPRGSYMLKYSYLGYHVHTDTINLDRNIRKNVMLTRASIDLESVELRTEKTNRDVSSLDMGLIELDASAIRELPAMLGETDVLKSLQLLPGVQAPGEGLSGLVVRGGNTDQNLILLDEASVYNPSHLMGFFSVFNSDALKNIELFKSSIPARYGGRLSSVLEVNTRNGSNRDRILQGGIGTVASRISLEFPVIRERSSVLLSGRRSYADLFLPLSTNEEIRNNRLYFYDLNGKFHIDIDRNNRLFYSFYKGRDAFLLYDIILVTWGNITQTLRWNHLFSDRLFSNLSLIYNRYDYNLGKNAELTGIRWESDLYDASLKYDISFYIRPGLTMRFGLSSIFHHFNTGTVKGISPGSIYNTIEMPSSNALESSIYLEQEAELGSRLAMGAGIRISGFLSMGKATVYHIGDDYKVNDTTLYGAGEVYSSYFFPEPRITLRYSLSATASVKMAYTRTRQYLHLASNSRADSPLDIWLPSSPAVKPQRADQYSVGFFRDLDRKGTGLSLELFYKHFSNQVDFRDHADIYLNPALEAEFRFGDGWAYGAEFLIRKSSGRLTGWLAYTLSRAEKIIPEVNQGRPYPSEYDRRHDLSIVTRYSVSPRLHFALNWIYASGAPVTFPSGRFTYGNAIAPVYTGRNSSHMPDYHRLDLSLTLQGKKRPGRRYSDEWNFSVYNAYYRKNAWLIYFTQDPDAPLATEARKLYMFPVVPAITYNFIFQ